MHGFLLLQLDDDAAVDDVDDGAIFSKSDSMREFSTCANLDRSEAGNVISPLLLACHAFAIPVVGFGWYSVTRM